MNSQLTLTHTLNSTTIPVSNQPRLLYLLIETGGGQAGSVRVPVHLALVVDKSDSMMIRIAPIELQRLWMERGWVRENVMDGIPTLKVDLSKVSREELQKLPRSIDAVKQALRAAVEALGPSDHFALVLFAGQAVAAVPLSPSSERKRILSAVDTLEELALGDETYMGRGISQGLEELARGGNPAAANRVIVLTDGFTLDEADCRVLAQRAKAAQVSISTMGLGEDFNEDLLIPMADETGGHAYVINTPGDIPAAFQQELNAVQSIAYRNLELKLRLSQGVELRAAHRVRPVISHLGAVPLADRSASLSLGDYEVSAPPALLMELLAPPRSTFGAYRLAQLMLAYDDPAGGLARQTIRQDIVVNYIAGPSAESPNPRVMNVVERVTAFKLQTRALEDVQRGDIPGATRKLQAAATRLLDMGETDLAQTMQEQAQQLAQQGQVSPETAKAARYKTRKLTQKLD
jgi:Ca-activated chloride channel family protein